MEMERGWKAGRTPECNSDIWKMERGKEPHDESRRKNKAKRCIIPKQQRKKAKEFHKFVKEGNMVNHRDSSEIILPMLRGFFLPVGAPGPALAGFPREVLGVRGLVPFVLGFRGIIGDLACP